MEGTVLKQRYGIIQTLTNTDQCHTYLAEDLDLPGNPNCWIEQFRLRDHPDEHHPKLLRAAQHLLKKEAALLKTLGAYPTVLTVQDHFEVDSQFYLVQEWLPGTTLAEQLQSQTQFAEAEVIDLLSQLLASLTLVHDHQTVHGNLCPQSILLHPFEQTWLLHGFGSVRQIGLLQVNAQNKVTLRRRVGNPIYCPRRWPGKLSPAYDLYSVGRIALHALTATPPHQLPDDWYTQFPVSDRLRTVLQGLLSQAYHHASEAQQWLRGTAATGISDLDASLTQLDNTDVLPGFEAFADIPTPQAATSAPASILAQRYRILEPLGDGGFGQTFLAQDEQFPGMPKCVVKHLRPYSSTPEMLALARRLFLSEAEVLSRLGQHPQIPHLLAHFEEDAEFYLVQDYVEGHDLTQELQQSRRWSEPKVIRLLRDILEVLSFVHDQKVIHRDIKPDNIRRRPDGKVVLIDFGAVKQVGGQLSRPLGDPKAETLTVAIGTPGYAPSEQTKGKPRLSSDVYAVGVIAIEALTGTDPEKLPEDPRTGELVWHDQAKVSPALRRVIDRMVRYDFRQRYPSAQEALVALEKMGSAQATVVRSLERLQKFPHFPQPWLWGGIATAALILLTTTITLQFAKQPAPETVPIDPVAPDNPQPATTAPTNAAAIPQLPATVVPFTFTVTDAQYSPTLNRLVMVSSNPNQLHLYSPLSQRLQNLPLSSPPRRVALDPQGRLAAIAHSNEISIVDLRQNQVQKVIPTQVPVHDVVLVSQQWLYYSSDQDPRLWGVNLQDDNVVASTEGDFTRTQHTFNPRRQTLVSLDATGTQLRSVDIAENEPKQIREIRSNTEQSLGDRLWLTADGQGAITNLGMYVPIAQAQDNFASQNLALANLRAPSQGRIAIAPMANQLFALDGPRLDRLIQFDAATLKRQQTWQLPNLDASNLEQKPTGRFVFVNPQGSEYYILVQGNDNGAFQLLRGTF